MTASRKTELKNKFENVGTQMVREVVGKACRSDADLFLDLASQFEKEGDHSRAEMYLEWALQAEEGWL